MGQKSLQSAHFAATRYTSQKETDRAHRKRTVIPVLVNHCAAEKVQLLAYGSKAAFHTRQWNGSGLVDIEPRRLVRKRPEGVKVV